MSKRLQLRQVSFPREPWAIVGTGVGGVVKVAVGVAPVTGVTVVFPVATTVPTPRGKSPSDKEHVGCVFYKNDRRAHR